MRRLLVFLFFLAVAAIAIGAFLYLTTPKSGTLVRFPLSDDHAALLMRVPASAESFALIPTAPQLHAKLKANPITRDAVDTWAAAQQLPKPWLLGGADIVAWKNGKRTSYALSVDPFRAFLVRTWLMFSSDVDARWDGRVFLINAAPGRTLSQYELEPILRLSHGLPEGDVMVVQRESARGAFPPGSRPVVTSVRVTPQEIVTVSHARTRAAEAAGAAASTPRPLNAKFPKGALLSASFASAPRILDDLRRLLRADIASLVADGGGIAIYDVDTGTLLPRPEGLVIIPADAESRAAMRDIRDVADLIGETRDTGEELLVSFDRDSVTQYLKDGTVPATWPATRWAFRMDPVRMIPILEKLGDNAGLRIAAPRIHRAARDLRRWVRYLQAAEVIEAADSVSGGVEELRVRIASK